MRRLVHPICVLLMCLPIALAAEGEPRIKLGVRNDVKPFVWKDSKTNKHKGFFWDICRSALQRAGFTPDVLEITASQRKELLEKGTFSDKGIKQSVDLLCDPTTINLGRMNTFTNGDEPSAGEEKPSSKTGHFEFSPILYIANGSYFKREEQHRTFRNRIVSLASFDCSANSGNRTLESVMNCSQQKDPTFIQWFFPLEMARWLGSFGGSSNGSAAQISQGPNSRDDTCETLISALNADNKSRSTSEPYVRGKWPPQLWPVEAKPEPLFEIWGYIEGSTIGDIVKAAARAAPDRLSEDKRTVLICAQSMLSHEVAAQKFCAGEIYRYYGDIDLIRAAVEKERERTKSQCPADETPSTKGTYEPYALVLSRTAFSDENFTGKFNMALYSMFSDGEIEGLYRHYFNRPMSDFLNVLFSINQIPGKID